MNNQSEIEKKMPHDKYSCEPIGTIYAYYDKEKEKYYYVLGMVPEPARSFIRQYLLENARAETITEFDDDCPGGWGHDCYCGTLYIYVTNEEICFRMFCVRIIWYDTLEAIKEYRESRW